MSTDPLLTQSTAAADGQQVGVPGQRLIDYLRALRRRWWLIPIITALVTAAALLLSLTSTKQYDATAKLLLNQNEAINTLIDPNASSGTQDPERQLNTDVELIKLDAVAARVRQRLRLRMSTDQLLKEVSTEVGSTSNVVGLTVRDTSPRRAARIANAFAREYVAFQQQSARASLQQAATLAQTQLNSLSPTDRDSPQGRQLQQRLRELQIAAALQTGGVEIVRRATVPTGPSRPRPALSAALGLLLGLLLGVAAALILEFADRRLKDERAVEDLYGLPMLASIPRAPRRAAGPFPGDDPGQREAYGMLAANLRFSALSHDFNTVMITSPSPEEGKTSVTLGLARALALLGQRVIAIEADLRRPSFARYAQLEALGGGLSAVLNGGGRLSDKLIWLDASTFEPVTLGAVREGLSFAVLPVGPIPLNPARMLARPAMAAAIQEARALADVVLIDTAPVGTVNDAVTLVPNVDGVMIVSRLNKTTKDAARRTLRLLRNFDVTIPGIVITDGAILAEGYQYYAAPDGARSAAAARQASPA
jgi:non-specific protein-tyrosine kinase